MNTFTREELRIIIKYLSGREEYKKSIAPRTMMAYDLQEELNAAGINMEDHVFFITNNFIE